MNPRGTTRMSPTSGPRSQWLLSASAMRVESVSVKATRRQPSIEARPRGPRGAAGVPEVSGIGRMYLTQARITPADVGTEAATLWLTLQWLILAAAVHPRPHKSERPART